MEFIKIAVERRASAGTRNSRKIRGEGRVPAVLYGLGRDNASLSIEIEVFESFLATGSKLVELKLGDKVQQAILKDVQHDPLSDEVLHIDLQRIDEHHEIEAKVPFEFKGIAKGITEGGVFEPVLSVILVRCTPARLPKVFLLDISHLQLDEAILVKDLKLPEGVKVLNHRPDDHVAHCVPQKVVVLETPTAATDGASPAEPERIGGKKPDEDAPAEDGAKGAAPKKDEKKDKK